MRRAFAVGTAAGRAAGRLAGKNLCGCIRPGARRGVSTLARVEALVADSSEIHVGGVDGVGDACRDAFPSRLCMLTSHRGAERGEILMYFLQKAGYHCLSFPVPPGPPTVESLRMAENFARRAGCEGVAAFGGGSVVDAARILAMKLTNPSVSLHDYMKVVQGEGATAASAPLLLVPSCLGVGTELTSQAYLAFEEELMLPVVSAAGSKEVLLADVSLQQSVPRDAYASQAVTTIMHLMETYTNPVDDDEAKALALKGLGLAASHVDAAVRGDQEARNNMLLASLVAGAGLHSGPAGVCQALALSVVAKYNVTYSDTVAKLATQCLGTTIETLEELDDDSSDASLAKLGDIATAVTGGTSNDPNAAFTWLADLTKRLDVGSLEEHDFEDSDFTAIATAAEVVDSMQAHIATLSRDDLVDILSNS